MFTGVCLTVIPPYINYFICIIFYLISSLFNQVGQLRTSSHLQPLPGQDKAKQYDKNNTTELHVG